MSASEVTDFERSFRYFAIWLHGQVFSKLLLGLFFQCQKSAWTYFTKLKTASTRWGRNKAEFEARLSCKHVCECAPAHVLLYFTWPSRGRAKPSRPPSSQPPADRQCLVGYLFPWHLVKPQMQWDCPAQLHCPWLGSGRWWSKAICETIERH